MSCPVSLKSILTKQGKCLAVSSLWSIPFQDDCLRRPSSLYSLHKAVHFRIDALDRGRDAIRRDGPEIEDILGFRWGRGQGSRTRYLRLSVMYASATVSPHRH